MRRFLVGLTAALALVGGSLGTRAGASDEPPFASLTADTAVVNRTGGISISGSVDCTDNVNYFFEKLSMPVPENLTVLVNVDWTANQPAGRRMIEVKFQDGQASPCFTNWNDPWMDPPTARQPFRWDSKVAGSDGFVYGNGKFVTGNVHVSTWLKGGYLMIGPDHTPFPTTLGLDQLAGFDLRATKAR